MAEAAVEPTDAEYEEATALFQDDFRVRDLARLLAQIRVANERAKENFNDAKAYAEVAKWQRERAEAAEAIAAVSEHQTENPRKPS